jgi:hypothetical protein
MFSDVCDDCESDKAFVTNNFDGKGQKGQYKGLLVN